MSLLMGLILILDVANGFADHFKAVYSNSNYVTEAKSEFEALLVVLILTRINYVL